ncbi:hypothetical protein NKH77_56130 [Streptomyces sp. M19]
MTIMPSGLPLSPTGIAEDIQDAVTDVFPSSSRSRSWPDSAWASPSPWRPRTSSPRSRSPRTR